MAWWTIVGTGIDFVVVDVETTGLFPGGCDRIIEIAALRLGSDGGVIDEYVSLINPQRDLGPTPLHRIQARDVLQAPVFEDVAGDVLALLVGAVCVGHNVSFDSRFVEAEMTRAGYALPPLSCLCTLQLARRVDPYLPSRRLTDVCRHFGVPLESAHSAYHDARAAAGLLQVCVERLGGWGGVDAAGIGINGLPAAPDAWPRASRSGKSFRRRQAAEALAHRESYVGRLVAKLPPAADSTPELDDYHALLDRVLEDRRVTEDELRELRSLATDLGLSQSQAVGAHRAYLRDLIGVALEDEVVTDAEHADLDEVRRLLAISREDYEVLLAEVSQGVRPSEPHARMSPEVDGKTVCFTGTLRCHVDGELVHRSFAEQAATTRGMVVKKNVTKRLDYLVVADPDSMSGKARKAREYGVRILAEPVFWRAVGINAG